MEEKKMRFDRVQPLDKLARDILADIAQEPLAVQAADQVYIDTGFDLRDHLKTAKVLRCTPSFWMWLSKVKDVDTMDTSGDEYLHKIPSANWTAPVGGTDGWSLQLSVAQPSIDSTRIWHLLPPEERTEINFLRRFPVDIAQELTSYDALIFLFVRPGEHDGMTMQQFHCYTCVHECYDMMMDMTVTAAGWERPKWGSNRQDPAFEYFTKFYAALPQKTKAFYETRPQADKIDLWKD